MTAICRYLCRGGMRRITFAVGTLLFSFFSGCGAEEQVIPGRATVTGVVTFEGQALNGGSISFLSPEKQINASTIITSGGRYATDRAAVGENLVSIETESLKNGNMAAYVAIPAKYNSPATSGLEVDIQPGENESVDFALEGQAK